MAEERGSKDLLRLETNSTSTTSSTSCLESKLFVGSKQNRSSRSETPIEKPPMFPVPRSQVLGKVKDFLSVFSEANKKLLHDAKENPDRYNIEVLNGKESDCIEMDLMLGVADLHTPEAVAAAEAAMVAGNQPRNALEESSSDESSDDEDSKDKVDIVAEQNNESDRQPTKFEPEDAGRDSSRKASKKQKPKKRSKIVELS